MGPTAEKTRRRSWVRHVRLAVRKRWVQLCLLLFAGLLTAGVTFALMAPKPADKALDSERYKFIHCDQCKLEMPYNTELVEKRCPRCPPPKTGFFLPTERSIKSGGDPSPWRWLYVTLFLEGVVMLGGVTYLLYLPVTDPTQVYYVVPCPHCGQRLRYRAVSLGGLGSCSRCKRVLRFPEEENAVTEAQVMKADETARLADAAADEAEEG
jgi:hypothetical protein